ncbi:MAG TPA: hypothetical protein VK789_02375 [Bryobacteraceae bacterium]|jgi:hypothetical protein|nr:hypothetical protein [Bryobacteraceae bacterium]
MGETVSIVEFAKSNQKEKPLMRRYLPVFAALATSLMSSAFVPLLKASESDEKTVITTSQPIDVQGTILPAGQYVLKLQESPSNRNVIYVFSSDERRLMTTILANHAYRLDSTDKSAFSFYGSPDGQPAALHTWFYPGETSGFEFLQRKHKVAADSGAADH